VSTGGACTVAREWADGAKLTGASTWAQVHGRARSAPGALGWETHPTQSQSATLVSSHDRSPQAGQTARPGSHGLW